MIDSFKWCVCCVVVLILQFAWSPTASCAAAEMQVDGAGLESAPSEGSDRSAPVKPTIPAPTDDSLHQTPLSQMMDETRQVASGVVVSREQNLADLIGETEISVLADAVGEFVKSIARDQILADGSAKQVDETDLLESIRIGRGFNRESLAALERTEQAKSQSGQALAHLLPTMSVRANKGYEKSEPSTVIDDTTGELVSSSTHLRTDFGLTVSQPLFDLPSYMDWRRRKVLEQARGEGYRVKDGDAYISTVNAYLSLVSTRLQAELTRELENQLAELLSYIEKRANAGAASVSDMARVNARSQATLSSRLEQESAHAAAGTDFVRLTNLVPQKVRIPVIEDVGASYLPESFEIAVDTAMKFNPEIAALTAELEAAKIDQSTAKGKFMPRLDAEYTDTYSNHAGGSPDSQRDRRLMLVLNWNLLSGGGDVNYYNERTSRHRELQYRLDDQRRRVVQSLLANYAALVTTGARITSAYHELESISTAAEAMSKRMLSGNQSLLDLLDVLNQRYQARSRLVSLHVLEMNTVAQLVRLTHGAPWTDAEGAP